MSRSTVLFIGAHADDIELGAGATCARLAAKGFDVHVIVMTDERNRSVARRRRREATEAARILGVPGHKVHFLGLDDGEVACNRQSVSAMRQLAAEHDLNPVAVFTHTDRDSHNDHVETFRIVHGAFRNQLVFKYQVRNSAIVSGFHPTVHCPIDDLMEVKGRALLAHGAQVLAGRLPIDKIERFARRFAECSNGSFVESFELDVQNGAERHRPLLAALDAQPFDRFWGPLLERPLAIVAGPLPLRSAANSRTRNASRSSLLSVVGDLQATLLSWRSIASAGVARKSVRIEEASRAGDDLFSILGENAVVVGSAAENPAAAALWTALTRARLTLGPATPGSDQIRLADRLRTRTGAFADKDFALITLATNPLSPRTKGRRMVLWVEGTSAHALASSLKTLRDPKFLRRFADDSLDVTTGDLPLKQWLVPLSRDGRANLRTVETIGPLDAEPRLAAPAALRLVRPTPRTAELAGA